MYSGGYVTSGVCREQVVPERKVTECYAVTLSLG